MKQDTEVVRFASPSDESTAEMNDRLASSSETLNSGPETSSSPHSLRRFVIWSFIGGAVGVVIVLIAARQANYDPIPTLTESAFDAAVKRWQSTAVPNYDIEIRVTGPQAATYRASVRDGNPTAAWRNGKPLTTRRTFGTWSVPGMFSTMGRDVAALKQAAAKGRPPPLILRASFHPIYGYPERYQRIDNGSRKGSDSIAVTWEVLEFQSAVSSSAEPPDIPPQEPE